MFSGFMVHAWIVATIVAIVGGAIGFFVVLRGAAFVAHAVPNGSFAGAAAASLVGVSTLAGLAVFSVGGALGIGLLGRRGRQDVATALTLVFMLGLGSLFLALSAGYASAIYSLLFGEVLGISAEPAGAHGGARRGPACSRWPSSTARCCSPPCCPRADRPGASARSAVEAGFLVVVALATTMTVPVVGTALIFSLMIGPPAAARAFTRRPGAAVALSVAIALVVVWAAIALSYQTDWPVGFFVGAGSAGAYACGRAWMFARNHG